MQYQNTQTELICDNLPITGNVKSNTEKCDLKFNINYHDKS